MRKLVINRRQVLRGAGGLTIGLPFLPSLVEGVAYGVTPMTAGGQRLVALAGNHGGVREATMYPSDGLLTKTEALYTDHSIAWGELKATTSNGRTSISGIANAPSGVLTERLVSKMNVIRGLDVPWYIAHNTGGHLGNYARNDGNGSDGKTVQAFPTPTIDQLLAYSPKFYKTLEGNKLRVAITGHGGGVSYNFTSPTTRSGGIQEIKGDSNPGSLFQKLFDPGAGSDPTPVAKRKPIVDRVLASYKSLRESNRRLSVADRQRLDDHMERLAELQSRVQETTVVRSGSCKEQKAPAAGANGAAYFKAINSVITTAFLCGTTRLFVVRVPESEFVSFSGSWHQDHAHKWDGGGQAKLVEANQKVFENVFVDLVAKLDVEEQPGQTLLDATLVTWTNECGEETHDSRSRPTFTAGSAGGVFHTGRYIDYRNKSPKGRLLSYGNVKGATGLTHNQFLATILQGMGLPPSDWQNIPNNGKAGYGNDFVASNYRTAQVPQVMARASDMLPIFTV